MAKQQGDLSLTAATVSTWDRPRNSAAGAPFGDMHATQVMEQYSVAFVHALATRARCKLEHLKVDDEQVDVSIRQHASHLRFHRTQFDVQLKCTAQDAIKSDGVHFSLKRHQLLGLREPAYLQKALVVLVVDEEFDDWMAFSPAELIMRGQAFWMSCEDLPDIDDGAGSKTVVLPLANSFNVDQLLDMLKRVGDGGKL